jgi:hypothetical protein
MLMYIFNEAEWHKGYKAFLDGRRYDSMQTAAERAGWEAARNDTLAVGQRIAKQGR